VIGRFVIGDSIGGWRFLIGDLLTIQGHLNHQNHQSLTNQKSRITNESLITIRQSPILD
jgi:hypothetical protein